LPKGRRRKSRKATSARHVVSAQTSYASLAKTTQANFAAAPASCASTRLRVIGKNAAGKGGAC
jgi:hypothetical protein